MSSIHAPFKEHWLVAMPSSRLKTKPLRQIINNMPILFYRHPKGVAALLDRCPHRQAPLSSGKIKGSCIECPYHGWQFNSNGACEKIPGFVGELTVNVPAIPTYPVQEKNNFIWIHLGENAATTSPYIPPLSTNICYDSTTWALEQTGDFVNILENFLDGTHTHFVHSGLIRTHKHRRLISAHLTGFKDRVEIQYKNEGKQSGLISYLFEKERGDSFARFIVPGIAELEFTDRHHTTLTITAYFTPVTETHFRIHALICFKKSRFPSWLKKMLIFPFFKLALNQDQRILNLQHNNVHFFKNTPIFSTKMDLMRPFILKLLQGENIEEKSKTIRMEL